MTKDALEDIVQRRMKNTGESHDVALAAVIEAIGILDAYLAEGGSVPVVDFDTGEVLGHRTKDGFVPAIKN